MTTAAERLLHDALKLPADERAEIAAELLASLDDRESDIEAAWAAEIARRAAHARNSSGEDEQDWRSALADVQREVLSR